MAGRERPTALLLTCEHGGNRVPPAFRALFAGHRTLLASHRGHDLGALSCARALAAMLRAPLIHAEVTRLLVDLNRSPQHPALFSEISRTLPPEARTDVLVHHYFPHRRRVEGWIAARIRAGRPVLHVAVHSFTPVLAGKVRNTELGLLYDPHRSWEARLCRHWRNALREAAPHLRVRRNYPYRGISDGFTRHLRTLFPARSYAGIELEINQAALTKPPRALAAILTASLGTAEMASRSRISRPHSR